MTREPDPDDVRGRWDGRSGAYSPAYYAHHGPDATSEAVRRTLDRFLDRSAAVLELGCGSGRHLSHLYERGFDRLAGIDLNPDAFDVMGEAYPEVAAAGTFHAAPIEDVVGEFGDGRFDAVYSVETLQHLHPDAEWVFGELARITGDLLVTVENEGDGDGGGPTGPAVNYVDDGVPLYYRDWHRVFTDLGLVEVAAAPGERDTLRAFRAGGA